MGYTRADLELQHQHYKGLILSWEYFIRSYLGGKEYAQGKFLQAYQLEFENEYYKRIQNTPLDNHCRNVIDIYSSFLFRVPPVRQLGSLEGDQSVEEFIADADLEGRSFNSLLRESQRFASVYGHVWLIVDKPSTNVMTRAEELDQGIRPYLNIYTPENVLDWHYTRNDAGYYYLDYLKIREEQTAEGEYYKLWYLDKIDCVFVSSTSRDEPKLVSSLPNPLMKIPAVILYNQRSPMRGLGVSDLTDVADLQKAIYNEFSEIEQIIRLSNHPSLVKTKDTDAGAGAGSIIEIPENLDANLKPYILQPNGSNLDGVLRSITHKVEAINRLTHVGTLRATAERVQSGIALRTEFELLNARLSEKSKLMELAEEQIWRLFADWQETVFDGEIEYPESFDIRDWATDLELLQQAKASNIKSATFAKEIDKQIARTVIEDDTTLEQIDSEIDGGTEVVGEFAREQINLPTI
jgi:hypothetical protein